MNHKIISYISLAVALIGFNSCIGETPNFEPANPGDEVSFSLNLNKVKTKTTYGDITDSGIKVEWSSNDKVAIYGVQCARKTGEYTVMPSPTNASLASSISMVGDAGVQWGTVPSEFYAVYPSNGETKFDEIEESSVITGVKVATQIRAEQTSRFTWNGDVWSGTTILNDRTDEVMLDNIMCAYAPVPEGVQNAGYDVNLNFKPIATVLKFHLAGWQQVDDDNPNTVQTPLSDMNITRITLTAPVELAGQFNLSMKGLQTSVDLSSQTLSKKIDIHPLVNNSYITIGQNEPLEFNVYCIPRSSDTAIGDEWNITLTTNHGVFTYPLIANGENAKTKLFPGKIHNLKIPLLPISESDGSGTIAGGDKSNWIERVDPTIYLSELSLPGAWYCYDATYQPVNTVEELWSKGVRAFHIDCRATGSTLYCAGTETNYILGTTGTQVVSILNDIASEISETEYAVAVLTIAEKKFKGGLAASSSSIAPSNILPLIQTVLQNTNKLYTEKITPSTTIDDVLGSLIVKINANTTDTIFTEYNSLPTTLISTASLQSNKTSSDGYVNEITLGEFTEMQSSSMYWGKDTTGLSYCYIQAQKTHQQVDTYETTDGFPTIGMRMQAISSIIDKSYEQYQKAEHNIWFQMGIGGFLDTNSNGDNHDDVAYHLNKYLYEKVLDKLSPTNAEESPVGIVLMNYCTNPSTSKEVLGVGNVNDFYGPSLIDAILKLNDSFKMKRLSDSDILTKSFSSHKKVVPVLTKDGNESGWLIVK